MDANTTLEIVSQVDITSNNALIGSLVTALVATIVRYLEKKMIKRKAKKNPVIPD